MEPRHERPMTWEEGHRPFTTGRHGSWSRATSLLPCLRLCLGLGAFAHDSPPVSMDAAIFRLGPVQASTEDSYLVLRRLIKAPGGPAVTTECDEKAVMSVRAAATAA